MQDESSAALLMGRLIDLLRRSPGAIADHKAALRGLVDLAARRSFSVRLEGATLSVEGVAISSETPFVGLLMSQMQSYGVSEIRLAHQAAPVDLLQLLQALSPDAIAATTGHSIEQAFRDADLKTVSVVSVEMAEAVRDRRQVRITDALASVGMEPAAPPQAGDLRLVSAGTGSSRDDAIQKKLAASGTMSGVIADLDNTVSPSVLHKQLEAVQASVTKALDGNRIEQAIDAIATLIRRETEVTSENARRAYGVVMRWLLIDRNLQRFVPYLLDDLYAADAITIIRRSGTSGTRLVVQRLADAPSFAERRTFLSVLRKLDEGMDVVANMLGHHEWYVVRNMADLAGDMKVAEAVPALRRAAEHEDARVRRSAGIALAKIGTPATAPGLARILRDTERDVRLAVAREISGSGLGALAMQLVTAAAAEQDTEVMFEYYRALGRIGTPDAIQALTKFTEPGGRLIGRRPNAPRLAAVEGLALARTSAARTVLQTLCNDSSREVRDAAKRALERNPAAQA